tara:strand:- start:90 stop:1331 length:1242 start_codon:yes stop_codon:yes gene_type:complete
MNPYFEKFRNMEPYFKIEEEEWTYIKENFSKEEIKESLVEILMEYPLPYADISEKECLKDYRKLKGMWWNDILVEGQWFPREGPKYRYPLDFDGKFLYFKRNNGGNKSSNYFQQKNRWSVDGTVSPGPARTWENEKFMYTLLGSLFSLKVPKVDKATLRTCISLRKYICSQFKPNVAKAIYDKYKCKNVLDFSAGWGDRLAGFYASNHGELYVGIDPRVENHPIYKQQEEFYRIHHGGSFFEVDKKCDFICSPAEDADLSKYENMMDIAFTSPPYFNVERYSYDDTQSWVRHKDIDSWNELFLHKALDNVWKTLRKGGILMVNISDVYANAKWSTDRCWQEICNPMNDFLSEKKDAEYMGGIGMEMARRPNCGGVKTATKEGRVDGENWNEESLKENNEVDTFCEPIWVWKKI